MQYRQFGELDWKGSALGFGLMRLPVVGGDNGAIDEPEAIRMVRRAIDGGVNYLDTAYGYHRGNSERFAAKALADGYRGRTALATKLPTWLVADASDFERLLVEQLEKTQAGYFDFYLLHGLDREGWTKLRDLGVREWLVRTRASGRIRHLGFSFHDDLAALKEIIDDFGEWDFCQIQYNYMDIENQAGTEGLRYAAGRGLGVVVMEGLLGGRLVNPPESVRQIWERAEVKRSPVEWALHWLWSQPEVSLVLSGMNTMQQVEQNLGIAGRSRIGLLSAEEQEVVAEARAKYNELCPIPCTRCDYCQPCPNKVHIPRIFELYNHAAMYNTLKDSKLWYGRMPMESRADMCLDCDECESKCPQHILISDWLPKVHQALSS